MRAPIWNLIRAELAERHFAGASGQRDRGRDDGAMDDLLRALFHYADAEHDRASPKLNQKIAVVARGGYGRGELNPQSDVDLLFLHDYKRGPYAEIVTEIMLHALWDAGLIVGHGVRTAKECVRLANEDLKEKTAILDARFLCGDEKLYAELDKLLIAEVLNRNQDKFFATKLEESRKRHAQYGDSIYLLEPQIKEGEGGLRDLHTAMWLAKVKYKVHSLEELVQKAVITRARSGRGDRGARFSLAGAQLAALSERAPLRSDHLRDAGADRADVPPQARGRDRPPAPP